MIQLVVIVLYLLITAPIAKFINIRMPHWIEESPFHHFMMKWVTVFLIGLILYTLSGLVKLFIYTPSMGRDMVIPISIIFVTIGLSLWSGDKKNIIGRDD